MKRLVLALSFAATMAFAVPALAGPNGAVAPSFFPVYDRHVSKKPANEPNALLGDTTDETRALPPGVSGKNPRRTFLRRPSEGK
jgi:hypothetical protein